MSVLDALQAAEAVIPLLREYLRDNPGGAVNPFALAAAMPALRALRVSVEAVIADEIKAWDDLFDPPEQPEDAEQPEQIEGAAPC
jgi:hypothetical protein